MIVRKSQREIELMAAAGAVVAGTLALLEERLETYHAETEPIVEHYRLTGRLVPLRAERTIAEVYAEIQDALATVDGAA